MFTANLILNIYIMLQNILNLEGVSVLSKKQQGSINGGTQKCIITHADGSSYMLVLTSISADDSSASGVANDVCVNNIASGETSGCHYDCGYDGFGQ
jgi:hypothetical protein